MRQLANVEVLGRESTNRCGTVVLFQSSNLGLKHWNGKYLKQVLVLNAIRSAKKPNIHLKILLKFS